MDPSLYQLIGLPEIACFNLTGTSVYLCPFPSGPYELQALLWSIHKDFHYFDVPQETSCWLDLVIQSHRHTHPRRHSKACLCHRLKVNHTGILGAVTCLISLVLRYVEHVRLHCLCKASLVPLGSRNHKWSTCGIQTRWLISPDHQFSGQGSSAGWDCSASCSFAELSFSKPTQVLTVQSNRCVTQTGLPRFLIFKWSLHFFIFSSCSSILAQLCTGWVNGNAVL